MWPLLLWKSNEYYIFWVRVYSLGYPACTMLYCHLLPLQLCRIFPLYLLNSMICKKKVIEHKMFVLIFSKNFVWNFSHFKKNSAKYYHKCTLAFMYRTHYSCQILIKLEFSWQSFKKYLNTKFHDNPFSGSQGVPCRQTDMTKLIITVCNFQT